MTIDVVIPCYNATQTLVRAVQSALNQPQLGIIWLVDDGSIDDTFALAEHLAAQVPDKIRVEKMPKNGGAAKARNWGALQSDAEFVAFLDADDAYENNALQVAEAMFAFRPTAGLVRLTVKGVGLPEHYAKLPQFKAAWDVVQMTITSNMVFRRAFFLACGGFPQHPLFREVGGEDGALGIATTQVSAVLTAFNEPFGVLHFYREGLHAERLLKAQLFNEIPAIITPEKIAQANAVSESICQNIRQLKECLNENNIGTHLLTFQWEKE